MGSGIFAAFVHLYKGTSNICSPAITVLTDIRRLYTILLDVNKANVHEYKISSIIILLGPNFPFEVTNDTIRKSGVIKQE